MKCVVVNLDIYIFISSLIKKYENHEEKHEANPLLGSCVRTMLTLLYLLQDDHTNRRLHSR